MADAEQGSDAFAHQDDALREILLGEFAAILKVDPAAIDPHKSFDAYGLDSIDAVIATDRLGERLEIELAPEFLLQHRDFAAVLSALKAPTGDVEITPLEAPIFLFEAAAGRAIALRRVADLCPGELEFVRVAHGSWQDWLDDEMSFARLAGKICDGIERQSPVGPIILAGSSQGGLLAFAAAMELIERNRRVSALILFDTFIHNPARDPHPHHAARRLLFEPALVRDIGMSFIDLVLGRPDHSSRGFGTVRIKLILAAYRWRGSGQRGRRLLRLLTRGWGWRLLAGRGGARLDVTLQAHVAADLWREWHDQASQGWHLGVPTFLLRATSPGAPDLGWGRFCRRLEVIPVAGDHESMFDPGHIEDLAAEFAAIVQRTVGAE